MKVMKVKPSERPHPTSWIDMAENLLKASDHYKSGRKRPELWLGVWCGRCGAHPGQRCIGIDKNYRKTAHVCRIFDVGRTVAQLDQP